MLRRGHEYFPPRCFYQIPFPDVFWKAGVCLAFDNKPVNEDAALVLPSSEDLAHGRLVSLGGGQ